VKASSVSLRRREFLGRGQLAAFLVFSAALFWGCKEPGEPSFPRAANKSDVPDASDTPTPSLIEPIPPNILSPLPHTAPEPLHVGGEVTAPAEISRVEPDCRELHGAGHPAVVELIVTETGDVKAGRVLRAGSPAAKPAILAAVRQWRFRPATLNGRPVEVYFTVTVSGCP
jgi:TonB family protein